MRTMQGILAGALVAGCLAGAGCAAQPRSVGPGNWFRLSRNDLSEAQYTSHPEYLKGLAAAYQREERYRDAEDTYMDALLLEYGDDFEGQVAMGQLYERRGEWNRAVAHYARARSIRPGHLAGWYHLERVKRKMTILPTGERADGYNPTTDKGAGGAGGADDSGDEG